MIVFKNPGLIDVNAAITLGVNVKEGPNPIGVFGTGLKYAIAVILREGGTFTIWRGNKKYEFTTVTKKVRGKPFQFICMNGRQLGFTTHLGHQWEAWHAYRELWSNCRDEAGMVFSEFDGVMSNDISEKRRGFTTIQVTGKAIEAAHANRHQIILQTQPLFSVPQCEVHTGESDYVFYKGIRVFKLPKKSRFTYNLVGYEILTEDRTLMYSMGLPAKLARYAVQATYPSYLQAMLDSKVPDGYFEDTLPYSAAKDTTPSPQFMEMCDALRDMKQLRPGVLSLFNEYRDSMPGYKSPYLVQLSEAEEAVVREAKDRVEGKCGTDAFNGLSIEFKSRMETGRVVGGKHHITVDHKFIKEGSKKLAAILLEGLAQHHSGSTVAQLCHLVLHGQFIPEELTDTLKLTDNMPF